MAYTPPAGDAVNFSFNGPEGYTPPAGDAVNFSFGNAAVGEFAPSSFSIAINAAAVLLDPPLDASATLHLDAAGELFNESLLGSATVQIASAAAALENIDTDFYTLCRIELQVAGELLNESLLAAPALAFSVDGEILNESLQGAARLRWNFAAAIDGEAGGSRAQPGINVPAGGGWAFAKPRNNDQQLGYTDPPKKEPLLALPWGFSGGLQSAVATTWETPAPVSNPLATPWNAAAPITPAHTLSQYRYPAVQDVQRALTWDGSIQRKETERRADWLYPPVKDFSRSSAYELTDRFAAPYSRPPKYLPPPGDAVNFSFDGAEGYQAPAGGAVNFTFRPAKPNRRSVALNAGHAAPFIGNPRKADNGEALAWGVGGAQSAIIPEWDITYPEQLPVSQDPDAPPTLPVYLLMPSIVVTRVSDGAPILCNAVSASTDEDSWSWAFSLTPCRREDLDLMRPDTNGPTEIEIKINGWRWHALVERYSRNRQFGQSGWTVQARSVSAVFAKPYASPGTRLEATQKTAQQLANDEIVLPGWSVQWDAVDWLVPGGVYSYENTTPMDSVIRLAKAAGAVVSTARTDKTLIVSPRYKVAPWDWPAATPDVVLPEAYIETFSGGWQPGPQYNAVYVSGTQQGVLVHAVRDGTGGNKPAPTVVDDLVTDSIPGRAQGIAIIGGSANREGVEIQTPLLPSPEAPGLIVPGLLLEVEDGDLSWIGKAKAVNITATRQNATTVRQNITVERNYAS